MTDTFNPAALESEVAEKNKVISHLTQTLSHTRNCLEIARLALEKIAGDSANGALGEGHARCREIALDALAQI